MRTLALKKVAQGIHEMSDLEHLTRGTPLYGDLALSIETLGALPSATLARLTCREHAVILAYQIVKGAYGELVQQHYARQRATSAPKGA